MKKVLNITLAFTVGTDLDKVSNVVDNLTFNVEPGSECVEVKNSEVVDFFEVF